MAAAPCTVSGLASHYAETAVLLCGQYRRTSGVGVLDKSVAILAALAERGPLSLAGLVEATGLSRPTAHRLAAALEAHRLVGRDGAGRYRLGLRLLGWAGAVSAELGLVEAARPVLEAPAGRDGGVGPAVRARRRQPALRGRLRAAVGLRDTVPVGAVLPARPRLRREGAARLRRRRRRRVRGRRSAELETIRRRGWAASVAEREEGVCSVSAPVLDSAGRIHAAVGVSGPINRLGRQPGRHLSAPVVAAARELERRAGLVEAG